MTFKADLHCHTTCSDGTMTPQEIVRHAKALGLSALAITDHDTIAAYEEAIPVAKQEGILLGVGAEFSSTFRKTSVHILAYDFPLDSAPIHALCQRHKIRRKERNQNILQNLSRLGFVIREEELPASHETIGRPHIAALMLQKKYVSSFREAFDLYIGDGKPCFDPGTPITTQETIDIIHAAKGKAFIAHPHLLQGARKRREIYNLPFDGIECYYGRFPKDASTPFLQLAKEKKWLTSGGSDFHGQNKEYSYLGSSWVDEETFLQIFQHPYG